MVTLVILTHSWACVLQGWLFSLDMKTIQSFYLFGIMMISLLSASATALPANNTTLNFGVFISRAQFDFSGFIPPLELGVQKINENQILKGLNGMNYFIQYELTNAMVSRTA